MASSIARKKVQNLGVPPGGTSNQVLAKSSGDDYDIDWVTGGGGGSPTDLSYNAATRVVASSTGTDATLTLADGTNPGLLASADFTKLSNTSGTNTGDNATNSQYSGLAASKQDTLVSATNIKTINGNSVLGSGDLVTGDMVLASAQTSTGKKTFQAGAADVGINVGSHTANPTNDIGGNVYFNSSLLSYGAALGTGGYDTIVLASDTQAIVNKTVNGVTLTTGGSASQYLNGAGAYATPAGGDPWTYVVLGSDFTISTTANNNVTGLLFTPAASTRYLIEGLYLLRTATTTTGARPGHEWPTGYDDGSSSIFVPNSNTASAQQWRNAGTTANAASTGLPLTTASYMATMQALLIMGGSPSGDFQVTLASETGAVNVTMRAGSLIRYREY